MNANLKSRRNKRGGQLNKTQKIQSPGKDRISLFSTIGSAALNAIKGTASFAADKGARFLGFKRIDSEEAAAEAAAEAAKPPSALVTNVTNIASGVANKANQVAAVVVEELNKKLENPEVKETVGEAIGSTVEAAKDILEKANEKLNDPEFVEDVAEAAKRASNTAATVIEAASPAIDKVIDQTSEIGEKMFSKVGESAVGIALNTAEAIPGVGAGIGLVRDIDKAATAAEAVVEAGMKTATTFSDAISETETALKEKMQQASSITDTVSAPESALKEKMQQASSITDRTNKGINEFNAADKVLPKTRGGASRRFKKVRRKLSRKLNLRR